MVVKGKWAQGIKPRNFMWIIKDRLAISERPGGYGTNHRRLRRQEEIIWIREQQFTKVISLIPSPHNLHNYDEFNMAWAHLPMRLNDPVESVPTALFPLLRHDLAGRGKILIHREELCQRVAGLMGGYLLWNQLVPAGPRAISIIEQITQRQLGPVGRSLVAVAPNIRQDLEPDLGRAEIASLDADDHELAVGDPG